MTDGRSRSDRSASDAPVDESAPTSARGPARGPASPRALAIASGAVFTAGVIVAVATSFARQATVEDSGLRALIIAALLTALHVRPRRNLATRSNSETINLDEVFFVPVVTMLEPWQSVLVIALASIAGSIAVRRSVVKSLFNVGQLAVATTAGIWVVVALGAEPSSEPDAHAVLAGMVAALTMTATTAVVVRVMVAFATGLPVVSLLGDIGHSFVPWTGAVTLGAIGVITVVAYPLMVILVAGVVLFVHQAYAASFRELAARRLAERLQQAVGALRSHTDPSKVRADLVAAATDLLGAKTADVVTDEVPDEAGALSAALGPDRHLTVSGRQGPGGWTEQDRAILDTLAGVAGDVLRSAEAIDRLRTITDSQSEGVIALDTSGRITFANPAARQMMGVGDDAVGLPIDSLVTLRDLRRPVDLVTMVARHQVTHDDDATLVSAEGNQLEVAYSLTPLRVEGSYTGAVLVIRDVTERRAFHKVLAHRALHDDLTDLPNRSLLQERLEHALNRSKESGSQHGLLFLDLDRFKLVNDSYGHLAGDRLLVAVAVRLRANLSAADTLARISGDEFVVLIEDVSGLDRVIQTAEHLLAVLREPHDLDGHLIYMSASMGVVLTHAGQTRDEALAAADAAAYAAKAAGRDCYRVSQKNSVQVARTRLDMEARMRRGLENEDFFVLYQPIVTADTGEVVGSEALVRWDSAGRGMIEPSHFIPLAEETGLIVPLGKWVLRDACRSTQEWTRAHPDQQPLSVSVNLSALQFSQHRLAEEVAATLDETGLAPKQLCLEITESVLMSDTPSTLKSLDALRELGVRVAIDDFGTGYSALSYLKRFPIDVVKLDRSFIRGLDIDAADTEIVSAVIRLSAALGIRTVAEGVEEEAQRRLLAQLGCTLLQGYLIARPLAASDFLAFWLRRPAPASAGLVAPAADVDVPVAHHV
jgi:diguanylate cyclase (GGDEF)-like protein/PAS domain S-box-containing protein